MSSIDSICDDALIRLGLSVGLRVSEVAGFIISWHSLRTTYVSRSVELEQSPAVVMANTGDSAATILKYYAKLPEVIMRRFVENKPVISSERV